MTVHHYIISIHTRLLGDIIYEPYPTDEKYSALPLTFKKVHVLYDIKSPSIWTTE